MRLLPNLHRYVNGQIACRSLRPFGVKEPTILAIPGGPGLSGQYLEAFLLALAKATATNVALLDLPNHGESVARENGAALDYPRCLELLAAAVRQIAKETGPLAVFGQSLGARLAFDLLSEDGVGVVAAALAGLPCRFENSSALTRRLAQTACEDLTGGPDDEPVFARNWRKILPLHTPHPLPPDIFEQLASGTKWLGNERMLDGAPPLTDAAAKLKERKPPLLVIQGGEDLVVPDANLQALKESMPYAEIREMPDAGHFVMTEKPEATVALLVEFLKKVGIAS